MRETASHKTRDEWRKLQQSTIKGFVYMVLKKLKCAGWIVGVIRSVEHLPAHSHWVCLKSAWTEPTEEEPMPDAQCCPAWNHAGRLRERETRGKYDSSVIISSPSCHSKHNWLYAMEQNNLMNILATFFNIMNVKEHHISGLYAIFTSSENSQKILTFAYSCER